MADKVNITQSLKDLQEIVQWFERQDEVDVETGLDKVKEAAKLIKSSKTRLAEIENQFKEIEMEIAGNDRQEPEDDTNVVTRVRTTEVEVKDVGDQPINLDDIPF
jgi:exonuclease VII small subunit